MNHCTRNAMKAGAGSLISRLLGFARDASFAWLLGGSATADAVSIALRLPYMVRRLFGEGTLSLALTTACAKERYAQEGHNKEEHGDMLAAAVTRRLGFWTFWVVLFLMIFAREALFVVAPGFADSGMYAAGSLDEAVVLFRIAIPYLFLAILAAGSMAALHSRERFFFPSLAPAMFNCTVLVFAAVAMFFPHQDAGILLVCGVLAGGFVQWAFLWKKKEHTEEPDFSPDLIRTVARRIPAGILGAAMPQLAFLIAAILTSSLPEGSMAALFYAERLMEFPLGVLGAAAGIAIAPRLARLAQKAQLHRLDEYNDTPSLATETSRALRLSLMLTLPATAGLCAVAEPLVSMTLEHGAFTREAVNATTLALYAYLPGLPAYALSRPLLAACHALDDTGTPARMALISLTGTAFVGWGLLSFYQYIAATGYFSLLSYIPLSILPPFVVSMGIWWYVFLLRRCLAGHFSFIFPLCSLVRPVLGATATFAVAAYTIHALSDVSSWVRLACAIPAGMITYFACLVLRFDRFFPLR